MPRSSETAPREPKPAGSLELFWDCRGHLSIWKPPGGPPPNPRHPRLPSSQSGLTRGPGIRVTPACTRAEALSACQCGVDRRVQGSERQAWSEVLVGGAEKRTGGAGAGWQHVAVAGCCHSSKSQGSPMTDKGSLLQLFSHPAGGARGSSGP